MRFKTNFQLIKSVDDPRLQEILQEFDYNTSVLLLVASLADALADIEDLDKQVECLMIKKL